MKLLINSSSLALWYDIIHDAEASCSINLKAELEAYLIFLMMRYTSRPDIANQIMAVDFLRSLNLLRPAERELNLQAVGDKCLIYSGLFPNLAARRLVNISYYVKIGQSAYSTISKQHCDLYGLLASQFVTLMDVIQSLRKETSGFELQPLQAYDLWHETGSQRALSVLNKYSGSGLECARNRDDELYLPR
jgi:hypothetical protein